MHAAPVVPRHVERDGRLALTRSLAVPEGIGVAGAFVKALKDALATPLEHSTLSLELKQDG